MFFAGARRHLIVYCGSVKGCLREPLVRVGVSLARNSALVASVKFRYICANMLKPILSGCANPLLGTCGFPIEGGTPSRRDFACAGNPLGSGNDPRREGVPPSIGTGDCAQLRWLKLVYGHVPIYSRARFTGTFDGASLTLNAAPLLVVDSGALINLGGLAAGLMLNQAACGARSPGRTSSNSIKVPQKSLGCRNTTGRLCAPSLGLPSPSTRAPSLPRWSMAPWMSSTS